MKTYGCALIGATVLCVAFLLVAQSCGGRIDYGVRGTLDDGGDFFLEDGSRLFGPGTACNGYDATDFIERTSAPPKCVDPTYCQEWIADAGLSFGFPAGTTCVDAHCVLQGLTGDELQCNPGIDGDAYCRAFFQQFVVRGVVDGYRCNPFSHACDTNGACGSGCLQPEYIYGVQSVALDGAVAFVDAASTSEQTTRQLMIVCNHYKNSEQCEPICLAP